MPWTSAPGAGFTAPAVEPWLPFGDTSAGVEAQRSDRRSVLWLTRDLVALRRASQDLRTGAYAPLETGETTWAYRRGDGVAVALNLAPDPASVAGVFGRVAVSTARDRDGETVDGAVELGPWEGVVLVASVESS
jgi:alpha-glucosidase